MALMHPRQKSKKKLEEKGYIFKFNTVAVHPFGAIMQTYDITAPNGKAVGGWEGDKEATQKYMEDYELAVKETKPSGPS